ncbi:GNAT family N-acetyltransferase [Deinococcus sp. HMF7604]|uniref:GNAT family N-acetyltransferase n=1 Tax=Deinococcus betulae TaxID=2873312 RepID=UPI001CCD9699|nr:GNAT family N-acetyltransferase [Deinococcus betulae]MBZ9753440.1 GNAT family N-acetyltransferase [Deinococcus betulae]
MTVLTTPRLLLFPLTREVVARRVQGAPFAAVLSGPDGPLTVQVPEDWPGDALALLPLFLAQWPPEAAAWPGSFLAVRRTDGQAIGLLGTKGPTTPGGEQDIGYGLTPGTWGQGYATEAVGALLAWLGAQPGMRVITAETAFSNTASARVLTKLGFQAAGQRTDDEDGELLLWTRPAAPA